MSNKTILVVEDDRPILDILDIILADAGYTPYLAQDGPAALD